VVLVVLAFKLVVLFLDVPMKPNPEAPRDAMAVVDWSLTDVMPVASATTVLRRLPVLSQKLPDPRSVDHTET
jgi:hypothetical protein